jgi:hypothetical protein
MREYSGNFDLLNAVSSSWWGRVVSSVSWQDNIESAHFDPKDQSGWGYRYRIRYCGFHSPNTDDLPDEQLPMANVVLPVTAGSGLGGFIDTPVLSAGSLVTGYWADGPAGQEPYITGVFINSNNDAPKKQPKGDIGGLQLFNDTYSGTTPQLAAYIPDYLIWTIKPQRNPIASTEYKVAQSFPYTLDELRQRTTAREQLEGNQVGDIVTDPEIRAEIEKERYIIENGTLPQ